MPTSCSIYRRSVAVLFPFKWGSLLILGTIKYLFLQCYLWKHFHLIFTRYALGQLRFLFVITNLNHRFKHMINANLSSKGQKMVLYSLSIFKITYLWMSISAMLLLISIKKLWISETAFHFSKDMHTRRIFN